MSRQRKAGARQPARLSGVELLDARRVSWTCPPALLRRALREDLVAARREELALVARVPDPARRRRTEARRRLSERPELELDEIVGQEQAVEAILAGLSMEAAGFHLFVCAPPGSGRRALVRGALREHRPPFPPARDRVYVANFSHPERPLLLTLPRGKGREFRRDLDDALGVLERAIPVVLEHESHLARCERIRRRWENQAFRGLDELAQALRGEGLIVGGIPDGFGTPELRIALDGEEPLPRKQVLALLAARRLRPSRALERRLAAWPAARERLRAAAREARALVRRGALRVKHLEAKIARRIARGVLDDLAAAYPTAAVRRWTRSARHAVGERVELFFRPPPPREGEPRAPEERRPDLDQLALFRANLFVDASERPPHPVLFEAHPTLTNLFGALDPGEVPAEHLRLRAGSLAQAAGGVIVVDAAELWSDPQAWRALTRSIASGCLELQSPPGGPPGPGAQLRPEPLPTGFKLIAIGTDAQFDQMLAEDPAFAEVFKVKVQLEDEVPRSERNVLGVASALLRLARRSGLLRPDAGALARLLEHSARLVGRRDRLSARFSELVDTLQEADRVARQRAARPRSIRRDDVEAALERRRRRHDLLERRARDELREGAVLIETRGARPGAVNALVVLDTGDHVFARPARITAAVGVGRRGVIDLEREAGLSGDVHHKGVQVLSGLLLRLYAQEHPLGLSASVCFEQSHGLVDGDSASAAEAVALISALVGLPARQDWALTGAITQLGELAAVGDVSTKVEGFFAVCRDRGLTGTQGVLVPRTNAGDLVLAREVVEAVRAGRFHVACADHLDEALELLLGRPAPEVHALAQARLDAFARAARRADPSPG